MIQVIQQQVYPGFSPSKKRSSHTPIYLSRSVDDATIPLNPPAVVPHPSGTTPQAQPSMQDLLAKLAVGAQTPPPPPLQSKPTPPPVDQPNHAQPTQATSDPSSSLKQLLGLGNPAAASAASGIPPQGRQTPTKSVPVQPPAPATPAPRLPPPDHSTKNSPKPTPTRPSHKATTVEPKKGDSGYIPCPQRNTPLDGPGGFDRSAAKTAILTTLGGGESGERLDLGGNEDSRQGKREFVRGLLDGIHVSIFLLGSRVSSGMDTVFTEVHCFRVVSRRTSRLSMTFIRNTSSTRVCAGETCPSDNDIQRLSQWANSTCSQTLLLAVPFF